MKYAFEINPRPVELGGGWNLRLLEDGREMGGGVFPVPAEDPQLGIDWWNGITEAERAHWLKLARLPTAAGARQACREADAYAEAEETAYAWLDSREDS